jgi:hypothetical protein
MTSILRKEFIETFRVVVADTNMSTSDQNIAYSVVIAVVAKKAFDWLILLSFG